VDDARELSNLIGLIYEAASRRDAWLEFLDQLAATLGVAAANLNVGNLETGHVEAVKSSGFSPEAAASCDAYYIHIDPYVDAGILNTPPGCAIEGRAALPQAAFERTEFYNDWYRVQGWIHGFGGTISNDPGGDFAVIACHRAPNRPSDETWQAGFLQLLLPHLERALQIQTAFDAVSLKRASVEAVFDRLPVGAILVDAHRRVVRANHRAEAILARNDGLSCGPDGLFASRASDSQRLQRCIAGATATTHGDGRESGGALTLPRPSGGLPLRVVVSPLAPESSIAVVRNAFAIVLVSDDSGPNRISPDLLEGLYGLTPSEAVVAALLTEGMTPQQVATANNVSIETTRSHLKQIFTKTDTSRQAELVRLLLLGPAPFGP
jgi:DNA-binding CsgD family transcriptional regulator/PAS domain-containing protein